MTWGGVRSEVPVGVSVGCTELVVGTVELVVQVVSVPAAGAAMAERAEAAKTAKVVNCILTDGV